MNSEEMYKKKGHYIVYKKYINQSDEFNLNSLLSYFLIILFV